MKEICVIGTGYVGLVNAMGFSELGNNVVTVDIDAQKVEALKKGVMPIYEPGLEELVERNVQAGRLHFTTSYEDGLRNAEFVFICVGTPEGVDGEADLKYVRAAAETIAKTMTHPLIVINKSTVPVGTGDWVADIIRNTQPKPIQFAVVSCPEFLREGSAVNDFMHPDRTVLGSLDKYASESVAQLYLPLRAPIVMTDLRTAEMIKYASNAFLATRISFINEISIICEKLGADVIEVAQGMGFDKRIGHHFLQAGVGYGGSCFEGDETIFVLDEDGHVSAKPLSLFFDSVTDSHVEVVQPKGVRVLSFNLETGCPEVADVLVATRRSYVGDMVTIKTSMGREIRVTHDHPVIRITNDGFERVLADEIQPDDSIMMLKMLPDLAFAPTSLNIIELLRNTDLAEDVHVSPLDDSFTQAYSQFAKHIPHEMLRHPHEIKQNNRMPLRIYWHLVEQGVLDTPVEKLQVYTAKGAATKLNAIIPINKDFMRLIGYYLAEGHISIDEGRAGAKRHRVQFTFHQNETEYLDDVRTVLSQLGLKFIERNNTNAQTIVVSSRIFAWLIRDYLNCGINSLNKALPRFAFNVSQALRYELLRGMFSGDGSVTPVNQGKNMMIEYATVSKHMADATVLLLQSLDVVPSVRRRMMNKSKHLAYIVRVSGYESMRRISTIFGEKQRTRIQTILNNYQRRITPHGYEDGDVFAITNVTEIKHETVNQLVYSLKTPLDTVITAGGTIIGQCFPKDVSALSYMAQTHGMHPQLLNAVMDINAFQRKHVTLKLHDLLHDVAGKTVGFWGLAFKENTDDIRESPALAIIDALLGQGAKIRAYDPVAMPNTTKEYPQIVMCKNPYEVAEGADAIVVATPWNEFKQIDMERVHKLMKQTIIVDGRNMYEPQKMRDMGFVYRGVGRGFNGEGIS
jgi:UDPglucose 6-dehydrogenase